MGRAAGALLLLTTLVLAACSFHLRGSNLNGAEFPFRSLYVKAPAGSPFAAELRSELKVNRIELPSDPDHADLTLDVVSEQTTKQILSLSSSGRVQEYQLFYRVSLRAFNSKRTDWLPAEDITMSRIMAYDDSQILAKEQEEALLYKDMRSDAVSQAIRRLSRAKPQLMP